MSDQAPHKFYLNGTIHHQIGLENNTGITNQNDSRQDEQQSIRYELNYLNERVRDIETELDEQPSIRDGLGNLKDRMEDFETELDRVKEKNTELENDAADLRSNIDHLTKVVKKLSSDMVNVTTDSRSKIDNLTNVVKTLKETSNETKEMIGGKRKGPILKKKRGLENVAPCSRDEKETKELMRDNRGSSAFSLCYKRYKELVNDAVSSGDEIDYERLCDMTVEETINKSGNSGLDLLKTMVDFYLTELLEAEQQ